MEEELEKIYQDLLEAHRNRVVTTQKPRLTGSLVSGGYSSGVEPINLDFTSLYSGIQKNYYRLSRQVIRKRKIRAIFTNPS